MHDTNTLADDFVIHGWTRMNGEWLACGSSPGVTTSVGHLPELLPEMVAAKLNELEKGGSK